MHIKQKLRQGVALLVEQPGELARIAEDENPGIMYTVRACLRGENPVMKKSPSRPLSYL